MKPLKSFDLKSHNLHNRMVNDLRKNKNITPSVLNIKRLS
jgi:hypothetical protein